MKAKTDRWILDSIGILTTRSKRNFLQEFKEPLSVVSGDGNSYHVKAKCDIKSGEVIEEIPCLILQSSKEELEDPILKYVTFDHNQNKPSFDKEGTPRIIGLGNFVLYRKKSDNNAYYIFDHVLNIVVVRALRDIKSGEEIFLASDVITEEEFNQQEQSNNEKGKKMGCGCGKNKNKNKPKKEEVKTEEVVEKAEFKSMVDGKELKTIKVD